MSDPVIWSKDPHTEAKHRILNEYLKAWFPIISSQYKRVIYIDGFAGPGVYKEGERGSPIIALQCLLSHSLKPYERDVEFHFLFIESSKERVKILNEVIKRTFPELPENVRVDVLEEEFSSTMEGLLDDIESNQTDINGTFAFIDPFGYGGIPFNIIKRILNYRSCEVFINFAYDSVNRFIAVDDAREQIFSDLFGCDEWQAIRGITDPEERNRELTALYTRQLQTGSRYVRAFEMRNNRDKIAYYLYFATNSMRGFELMKKAMWKVDPRGSFRFADTTDAGTQFLLQFGMDTRYEAQAEMIASRFRGRTCEKSQVENYCIENTPFPTLWRDSLKILEKQGRLTVLIPRRPTPRKRGTFPADCPLQFN